jgi:hypothetical protein
MVINARNGQISVPAIFNAAKNSWLPQKNKWIICILLLELSNVKGNDYKYFTQLANI